MEYSKAVEAANLLYRIENYSNLKDRLIDLKNDFDDPQINVFIVDAINKVEDEEEKLKKLIEIL